MDDPILVESSGSEEVEDERRIMREHIIEVTRTELDEDPDDPDIKFWSSLFTEWIEEALDLWDIIGYEFPLHVFDHFPKSMWQFYEEGV